jgi:hypothetical protein
MSKGERTLDCSLINTTSDDVARTEITTSITLDLRGHNSVCACIWAKTDGDLGTITRSR